MQGLSNLGYSSKEFTIEGTGIKRNVKWLCEHASLGNKVGVKEVFICFICFWTYKLAGLEDLVTFY